MTPRPEMPALLRALADALEREPLGERMLSLPEVVARLPLADYAPADAQRYVMRHLRHELPVIELTRGLEAFIRGRAALSRRKLRSAS